MAPRPKSPLPRLEHAQQLSEIVHKVSAREPINALERTMLAAGGSFGGAKPKALIEIAGEQWVIKFFNNEPIDVPLVRRYDRAGHRRIHCISAGTALRAVTIAGHEPELGYPSLAQLLRRSGVAEGEVNLADMQELFRRMVFNILIDNTDDHEKNHALLAISPTQQGKFRLAPAYDVLPTNSGQGYQEFIVGTGRRDSTLANAMSQCQLFGYTPAQAAAAVARVIQVCTQRRCRNRHRQPGRAHRWRAIARSKAGVQSGRLHPSKASTTAPQPLRRRNLSFSFYANCKICLK